MSSFLRTAWSSVLVSVAFLIGSPARAACVPAPSGLSAWFRLDDSAKDELGPVTGEVPGSATYGEGKVGRSVSLDGNMGVILGRDDRFDRGILTLETWVRRSSDQRASLSPVGDGAIFAGGASSYSLTMGVNGRIFLSHVAVQSFYFEASITDLEWHHLCMVRNGSRFRIFVDGQAGGEVSVPGALVSGGRFSIGSLSEAIDGQSYGFLGSVDELSLYSRELVDAEIRALYEAGSAGKCTGPIVGTNCEPLPVGATGWFPLDVDVRNRVNPATDGSAPTGTFGPGLVDGAAYFDGLNPGVILPDDPRLKTQDFTAETWIQRASTAQASQSNPPNGAVFARGLDSPTLAVAADGMVYFGIVGRVNYQSSGRITDLGWHHIAATKSGGEVWVYLDGEVIATHDLGGLQLDYSTPLAIGSLNAPFNTFNYTFWGAVDEFTLYNRPLATDEIRRIWASRGGGKCQGGLGLAVNAPAEVVVGSSFDYTVSVSNLETNAIRSVVVTNTVPQGFRVAAAVPSAGGSVIVIPGDPGSKLIYVVGDLAPGAQAGLRVSVENAPLGIQRIDAVASSSTRTTLASASASVHVRPVCSPAPDGLVACWRGESNTVDTVSGAAGTLSGAVIAVDGRIGSAFRLDGSGGTGVNLGRPSALQRSEFSIEAWIRRGSSWTVSPNSAGGTILGADTDGWNFALLNNGALTFGRSDASAVTTAPVVRDLAWHHVAMTRSAAEVRFYVDGTLALAQDYTETFKLDQDYGIGGIYPSGRNAFLGDLDEIAFYDRVLTAEAVAAVAGAGGAPKCVEDLVVATSAGGPIPLGEDWTVDWLISSVGSSASTGVSFTNSVPPGLLFVSATASQGTVENLAGVLRGNLGSISAGSNATVRVILKPLVPGAYSLSASVGRNEGELTYGNNRAEVQAGAVAVAIGLEGDVSVGEPDVAEFNVVLNAPMTRTVTVDYATVAGLALPGADFEAQAGTLEFPPGTVRQTVRVPVFADGLYENVESFTLVLRNASNAALGLATATGTIVSPDPIPLVRVRPVLQSEGQSGPTPFRFAVSMDRPSGAVSSFVYATTNDSAKSPTDFTSTQGVIQFLPGETNAVIEVMVNGDTAGEANETFLVVFAQPIGLRFPAIPIAPAVGTIINDDAISGLVTGFSWDAAPAAVTATGPFGATLSARDGSGEVVSGFGGVVGVQAFAGPGRPSSVVLTEISVVGARAVELQNVSPDPVDVSGWVVYLYDATRWPAPKASLIFPAGTVVNASDVFVVEGVPLSTGSGAYPRFRVNEAPIWSRNGFNPDAPLMIAAVVADASGAVQDVFFAGDAQPAEVGVPAVLSDEDWSGPPALAATGSMGYLRPGGQGRNGRRATDWKISGSGAFSPNLGRSNLGLVLPFADAVALLVAPEAVSGFTGGSWSGSLTLGGFAPQVRLVADDGNGHRAWSAPISVSVVDDLAVTMDVQPKVLSTQSWSSDFVVTVTNLGPVLSSNVTAKVLLPFQYGSAFNAVRIPPWVSQGTARAQTVGSQTEVNAEFGDLPPGGMASMIISAARRGGVTLAPLFTMESVATLTRDSVELNLLNNRAVVRQEFSSPCTPLGAAAVAWWRAETGFDDVLNGLTGTAVGGVEIGAARVGRGGFHFDGVSGAIRVADSDLLDFAAGDTFTLESWIRVPRGSIPSMALIGKAQASGSSLVGYALTLENGLLVMDAGDGVAAGHWILGSLTTGAGDLRDDLWHHVVVVVNQSNGIRILGWVDGNPLQSASPSLNLGSLSNDAPLRLGEPVPGRVGASLGGDLDEVIVYRRALGSVEIRAAYFAGAHGHCASRFALSPVTPRFTVQPSQWISQDTGVAGRPFRFQFDVSGLGPDTADAHVRVALSGGATLLSVESSGSVPIDPTGMEATAFLGPVAPGTVVPFAVTLISTNPLVSLNLVANSFDLSSVAASVEVRITLAPDSDQDGIPDQVELAAGLDPLLAADAGTDTDSDGFTAAQEFEAGTASNDAGSALRLRVVEGQVVFDALASRVYRLEHRSDLGDGTWNLIQTIRPEFDGVLRVGPVGEAGAGYYRVLVSPPY